MRDYLKDRSIPMPLAALLNDIQTAMEDDMDRRGLGRKPPSVLTPAKPTNAKDVRASGT